MRLSNFGYLCKEGARSIVRNKLMSFACIGVLMSCLLLIGGAAMLSLNIGEIFNFVEAQNEIVVLLHPMTRPDIDVVEHNISGINNVLSYTFVSSEEVYQQFLLDQGEFAGLFAGIPAETFPNRFIVFVRDLRYMEDTVARISGISGVRHVRASTEVASLLVGIRSVITISGAAIVLILVMVSIAIITNTIKLSIFSRRREINIMKYVGATDTFIRMPFLVEGIIIGLIAAVLAFLLLGFGYTYLLGWISDNFGEFFGGIITGAVDFWDIAHYIFAGFAALGVLVGMMGSGFFVRRHVKV